MKLIHLFLSPLVIAATPSLLDDTVPLDMSVFDGEEQVDIGIVGTTGAGRSNKRVVNKRKQRHQRFNELLERIIHREGIRIQTKPCTDEINAELVSEGYSPMSTADISRAIRLVQDQRFQLPDEVDAYLSVHQDLWSNPNQLFKNVKERLGTAKHPIPASLEQIKFWCDQAISNARISGQKSAQEAIILEIFRENETHDIDQMWQTANRRFLQNRLPMMTYRPFAIQVRKFISRRPTLSRHCRTKKLITDFMKNIVEENPKISNDDLHEFLIAEFGIDKLPDISRLARWRRNLM